MDVLQEGVRPLPLMDYQVNSVYSYKRNSIWTPFSQMRIDRKVERRPISRFPKITLAMSVYVAGYQHIDDHILS